MSQQMRRILAAFGLAAALLLAVPAPSRAASFREPSFAASLAERVWSWLWSLAPSPASSQAGQISTPVRRTGTSGTPPPVGTAPPGTDESGSHIDPDGKP